MTMIRRFGLFLATNLAVLVLLGIVLSVLQKVFGIQLAHNGTLLVFAAIFGFGGAMISLLLSRTMARRSTGAHVVTQPRNEVERWLFQTVERQARVPCRCRRHERRGDATASRHPVPAWRARGMKIGT